EGAVKFDAKSAIDLNDPMGVNPRNAKNDLALWFADPFNDFVLSKFRVFNQKRAERFKYLTDVLVEFNFARVASQNFSVN
ncbi:hypothetical protein M2T36_27165, partial [Escherichia coli]|uniref:hypothetical protein n=1 Tax=Escherichia coli TaxID=562 RepID=UPI00200CB90C